MQSLFARLFPTPHYLTLGSVGLDFSDATLRVVELRETPTGLLPKRTLTLPIPSGILENGRVVDAQALTTFLRSVKKQMRITYARVSIAESQVYSFTTALDPANAGYSAKDIRGAIELFIEEYIPLKLTETVFDFVVLASTPQLIVQVTAMSASASRTWADALEAADILPIAFELEGRALARAIVPATVTKPVMLIDFGAHRTTLAIIFERTVVFTSTIDFGGNHITDAIAEALSIDAAHADELKRTVGLGSIDSNKPLFEVLTTNLNVLKEEINRRYIYWHEKRQFQDIFPNVDTLYLAGGDSNLIGLVEYFRATLKLSVVLANPWQACVSFDTTIPEMSRADSLSYATAIGLALATVTTQSI